MEDRARDGPTLCMLAMIDAFTRECLTIEVRWRLNNQDVLAVLACLFVARGVPKTLAATMEGSLR